MLNKNQKIIYPQKNCSYCPRLKNYRKLCTIKKPNWHNAPVPSFGKINSKLLIVGLAPGLKGANKTGRPFTGDYAGDLLYSSLLKSKLAVGNYNAFKDDNLKLLDTRITNSVRCVPPQNKPNSEEKLNCRKFLISEIHSMKNLKIILALGRTAHEEVLKVFNLTLNKNKFQHGKVHYLKNTIKIYDSYHCSKYNTQTKRLTYKMFYNIIDKIKDELKNL